MFVSNSSLMKGGELHSCSFPFMLFSKLLVFLKQSTHLDSFSFKTQSDWVVQNFSASETKIAATFGSSSEYKLESLIFCIYSMCLLNQSFLRFLATSRYASIFLVAWLFYEGLLSSGCIFESFFFKLSLSILLWSYSNRISIKSSEFSLRQYKNLHAWS